MRRTDLVRLAIAAIAGSMHVVQAGVFLYFGHPLLALASLAATLIFAGMVWLVLHGHSRAGAWVGFVEMLAHISAMVFVWGPGANYWMYYVLLAGGGSIAFPPAERRDRIVATLIPMLLGPVVFLLADAPLVALDPRSLHLLALLNVAGTFTGQVGIVGWFATMVDRAEAKADFEQARSERLLLNILPASIAARLKDGPATISDAFPSVTVLFADLVGFTALSARVPTGQLIVLLNEIFSSFDALAERNGLEKIKTIGDAYMVVGGVPEPRADHAPAVARMALEMRAAIAARAPVAGSTLDLRIGIHSGPVVAGVIGTRKFSYDLWGDTVNTASRMESHGEPGRIQVSDATRALLGPQFVLQDRGEIAVKGKGAMRTWFLEGVEAATPGAAKR